MVEQFARHEIDRERLTVVRDVTHAAVSSLTNRCSGGSVLLRIRRQLLPTETNRGTPAMKLLPTILALALAAPSLAEAGSRPRSIAREQ